MSVNPCPTQQCSYNWLPLTLPSPSSFHLPNLAQASSKLFLVTASHTHTHTHTHTYTPGPPQLVLCSTAGGAINQAETQRANLQISGLRTMSKVRASGLGGPQSYPHPILGQKHSCHTHTDTQTQMHMSSLHRVGTWPLWAPACPGFILQ